MITNSAFNETKTHQNHVNKLEPRGYLLIFGATFAGVAFGVLMSLGLMRPILHSEIASATKGMSQQTVESRPANFIGCVEPSSVSGGHGGGALLGAQTDRSSQPEPNKPESPGGGRGADNDNDDGDKKVFIHKLVSGIKSETTGTNSNTGPDSNNVVKSTNTNTTVVENHNEVEVENENEQEATSGDVESKRNTEAGDASSGDATNTNETSFELKIVN